MKLSFKGSIYSFVLTNRNIDFDFSVDLHKFNDLNLYVDKTTEVDFSTKNNKSIIVFGDLINLKTNSEKNVAEYFISNANDINELINLEFNCGGKYVVIFIDENNNIFCLGDATVSIPIFYYKNGRDVMVASYSKIIVDYYSLDRNRELQLIRESSDLSQAMPYDVTVFDNVCQVIPNHYLDVKRSKVVRFTNASVRQDVISADKAAFMTKDLICNLASFLAKRYRVYCPITSGRDSRVVLAYLENIGANFECYTIDHGNSKAQDLIVPRKLIDIVKVPYKIIVDENVDESTTKYFDNLIGENNYSKRTLQIAYSISTHFKDGVVLNGDIIGQVGKCSLHRDISESLATPRYFRCKLHNYSKKSLKYIENWMNEIKTSDEKVNMFDLFSVENRMGRWAAQENQIYNAIGQRYMNIFNSRSIIYVWSSADRKERKESLIHCRLIELLDESLLSVPFEKYSTFDLLAKTNGFTYYYSSFLKYYANYLIFHIKRGIHK